MIMTKCNNFNFPLSMPHMVSFKLAEVELLKQLGACQWTSIAELVDRRPSEIKSDQGELCYASLTNLEMCFGPQHPLEHFDGGMSLNIHNKIGVFRKRIVESFLSSPAMSSVSNSEKKPREISADKDRNGVYIMYKEHRTTVGKDVIKAYCCRI